MSSQPIDATCLSQHEQVAVEECIGSDVAMIGWMIATCENWHNETYCLTEVSYDE